MAPKPRHQMSSDFLDALSADFESNGAKAVERVRLDKPDQYLKLIASILPKHLNVSSYEFEGWTDERLIMRIQKLGSELDPYVSSRRRKN